MACRNRLRCLLMLTTAALQIDGSWAQSGPMYGDFPARIYNRWGGHIVAIETRGQLYNGEEELMTGSGFIVDGRGYALTNAHVVLDGGDNYKQIAIVVRRGTRSGSAWVRSDSPQSATIVDVDVANDIALVKIETDHNIGNLCSVPDPPTPGESVALLGFPLDYDLFVDQGIVKGPGQKPKQWVTDAPVNPGNSGSPVFNAKGYTIGIFSSARVEHEYPDGRKISLEGIKFFYEISLFYQRPKVQQLHIATAFGQCAVSLGPRPSHVRRAYQLTGSSGDTITFAAIPGYKIIAADFQKDQTNIEGVDLTISPDGSSLIAKFRLHAERSKLVEATILTDQEKLP